MLNNYCSETFSARYDRKDNDNFEPRRKKMSEHFTLSYAFKVPCY